MIYDAYDEIPSQPVLVYQRIVNLHLEEWDRQRDVRRLSGYAKFGPERKRQFLAAMAYEISKDGKAGGMTRIELERVYHRLHDQFALPRHECGQVVTEIESHTGLLVTTGFSRYEFSHKSIQEYLVADYLSRAPAVLAEFPRWRYLADECAVALAISAQPSQFLWSLVVATYQELYSQETLWGLHEIVELFWVRFFSRLAIERPGMQLDQELTLALMYLGNLCGEALPQQGPLRELASALKQAGKAYHVSSFARNVVKRAEMIHRGRDVLELDMRGLLPPHRSPALPNRIRIFRGYLV